jgi:hypothetical protein
MMTLMMEAARTSETLVYSNDTTWRCTPEGSHLHIRRRDDLISNFTEVSDLGPRLI